VELLVRVWRWGVGMDGGGAWGGGWGGGGGESPQMAWKRTGRRKAVLHSVVYPSPLFTIAHSQLYPILSRLRMCSRGKAVPSCLCVCVCVCPQKNIEKCFKQGH